MPQNRQSKDTPARSSESTDSAAGTKALRQRILRELPAAADAISKARATEDAAQVHMVSRLGNQSIPFGEQPPQIQKTTVAGHPDSLVNAALSLRDDFSVALNSWEGDVATKFKKAALELVEIEPNERFVKTALTALSSAVKAREKKTWKASPIPGWLIAFPKTCDRQILLKTTFGGQLGADEKAAVLSGILARIDEQVENAETEALDEARILLAKQGSTTRQRDGSVRKELDIFQRTMKRNQKLPYRDVCDFIDAECTSKRRPIPLSRKCQLHGHKTLLESIDCPDCRSSATVRLSERREPLGLPKPPKSKFPRVGGTMKLGKIRN
jgi:hypothetical protein